MARLSRKAKRDLSWILLILSGLFVVYSLAIREGGYMTLRNQRQELDRITEENLELRRELEEYHRKIEALKNDPAALERLVRENDFARPDEVVVQLPD